MPKRILKSGRIAGKDDADRVYHMAALGFTPAEIERELGLRPFTIHTLYHKEMMQGFEEYEARTGGISKRIGPSTLSPPMTEEQRRKAEKRRIYYEQNKVWLRQRQNEKRRKKPKKEL